jgi:hypothetical protein
LRLNGLSKRNVAFSKTQAERNLYDERASWERRASESSLEARPFNLLNILLGDRDTVKVKLLGQGLPFYEENRGFRHRLGVFLAGC